MTLTCYPTTLQKYSPSKRTSLFNTMSETSKIVSSQPGTSNKASVLEPSFLSRHLFTSIISKIKSLPIQVFAVYVLYKQWPLLFLIPFDSSTKSMRRESRSSRNPYLTNYPQHRNHPPTTILNQRPSMTSPYSLPKKEKKTNRQKDNPPLNEKSIPPSSQTTIWWMTNNTDVLFSSLFSSLHLFFSLYL